MKSTRLQATNTGTRMLSDEFIQKIMEKHPYLDYEIVWSILNTALDQASDVLEEGKVLTLDKICSILYTTQRMHSPKFRKVYSRSEIKVLPRPWFHATRTPIEVYCYEFQWEPDHRAHSVFGKKKISTWCKGWRPRLQEENLTSEELNQKISEKSRGFLTEGDVKFYLKQEGKYLTI